MDLCRDLLALGTVQGALTIVWFGIGANAKTAFRTSPSRALDCTKKRRAHCLPVAREEVVH